MSQLRSQEYSLEMSNAAVIEDNVQAAAERVPHPYRNKERTVVSYTR